jgi:hypothetical protein
MVIINQIIQSLMSLKKIKLIICQPIFKIKTVDSPSQKPVPRGTDIEIPLTDVNLDITQMILSYFKIDVDIQLDFGCWF